MHKDNVYLCAAATFSYGFSQDINETTSLFNILQRGRFWPAEKKF